MEKNKALLLEMIGEDAVIEGVDFDFEGTTFANAFGGKTITVNEACRNAHNIEIITEAVCDRIIGNEAVGAIEYVKGGERFVLKTDAVFGAVGMVPASGIAEGVCDIDGQGYIIADENGRTSAEGIFAAGDVRTKKYRQIITACSDGACAAESAAEFLS